MIKNTIIVLILGVILWIVSGYVARNWSDFEKIWIKPAGISETAGVMQAVQVPIVKNEPSVSDDDIETNAEQLAREVVVEPEVLTADIKTSEPIPNPTVPIIEFPKNRIVAFYGNFYSSQMGILGEFSPDDLLGRLRIVADSWQAIDPSTQVIPAIHYIASTAQPTPSGSGLYTMRMPADQILKAILMGTKMEGITILDLQAGQANILDEVQRLESYLLLPNVHVGIDPEFLMTDGRVPGEYVGTIDAIQVNQVVDYLSGLVIANNLPPEILILHRFTQNMITNVSQIRQTPQVTTIVEMDGWGPPELKIATYRNVITNYNIPYSGFKIFYKNDLRPPSDRLITPAEILQLDPVPVYIQYQ